MKISRSFHSVHSYRSNRRAHETAKSIKDGNKTASLAIHLQQDFSVQTSASRLNKSKNKSSPRIDTKTAKGEVPSAQNFGFIRNEPEADEKPTTPTEDDSDMDETYFLGGAESVPQEDFILDPPEHFSESSIDDLEDEQIQDHGKMQPRVVKTEPKASSSVPRNVIHSDSSGMVLEFKPPPVSDDEDETNFGSLEHFEYQKTEEIKEKVELKVKDTEEESKAKRVKKKKKKRASKDLTDNEDTLRAKEKRKKKKAAKHRETQEDQEEEENENNDASLPEYLYDRGLDRVPMRASQDYSSVQATSSLASYRSNESLDERGNPRKRHKSYYGDVKATDEFTPPWLDDDPTEGDDDDDPYLGEDDPPNVVYDEEVSSLLW